MAETEQQNTTQLDLTGQESNHSSQRSDIAGAEDGVSRRPGEGVNKGSAGCIEEGKEAEILLRSLSPTSSASLNASHPRGKPDLQAPPSTSAVPQDPSTPATVPTRPTLVQLTSGPSQSGSSTSTSATTSHPKKFSSVNINKKFLEKTNSASTAMATATAASAATKITGSTISRPPTQSSFPHPRLVTTKLTATASSPSPATGWSRPSSTAPPSTTGASSPSAPTPAPPAPSNGTTSSASAPTAPQVPHAGKVIQPAPRSALPHHQAVPSMGHGSRDVGSNHPSTKPAWVNLKQPTSTAARPDVAANDFPTAAEVAQGNHSSYGSVSYTATAASPGAASMRKPKPDDQSGKEASPVLAVTPASKRDEEADTFRGVHLDPNAHHWDEMVEDDDNYWDNVIEFGDGRQYKVEAVEKTSTRSREPTPPGSIKSSHSARHETTADEPVSKEDRFADDFDRSWPSGPRRGPPVGVQQQRSPQESARVLFNERSNKLEPYGSHRLGPGTFQNKRSSFQERTVSPTESRSGSSVFHGLSKTAGSGGGPPDFASTRSRRFSGASNSSFVPPNDRDRPRDRDRRDGVGSVGRTASLRGRDREGEREKDFTTLERGRQSAMGPPPIPAHAWRNTSRESASRRLTTPTSINGPSSPFSAGGRRFPPADAGHPPQHNAPPDSQDPSPVTRGAPHSPALSHASSKAAWVSPATPSLPLSPLGGHDLEEIKKGVMHTAAERAKQRRQQEEEEREAQKERARKKATELEAKMKAETDQKERKETEAAAQARGDQELREAKERDAIAAKDAEVAAIINEAIGDAEKSKQNGSDAEVQMQQAASRQPNRRHTSQPSQHSNDLARPRRFSTTGGLASPSPSAAEAAETWRRTGPSPRQPDESRLIQARSPVNNVVSFLPPAPLSAIDQALADSKKEDLEIVDFTDMGKFVEESTPEQKEMSRKATRPVASDFFDDATPSTSQPLSPSIRNDIETWRRKTPSGQTLSSEQPPTKDVQTSDSVVDPSTVAEQVHKTNESSFDSSRYPTPPSNQQRPPRSQNFYHQAPMSSLVDAMSRIKGAIHDMHAGGTNNQTSAEVAAPYVAQAQSVQNLTAPSAKAKERWVSPSLRVKRVGSQEESREEDFTTTAEALHSPQPRTFVMKLPTISHEKTPVYRRQLYYFSRPPLAVRWDILSFDPPVEGMNKRNLSLNDVLFRPSGGYKVKTRYRVHLPRSKIMGPRSYAGAQGSTKANSFGVFGKQNGADTAMSWRKPTSPLPPQANSPGGETPGDGNVESRSHPPEPRPSASTSQGGEPSPSETSVPTLRIRSQPKMPEGTFVAFYRDVPEAEPKTTVNFIVSSELDDPHSPQSQTGTEFSEEIASEPTTEVKYEGTGLQKTSSTPLPKSAVSEPAGKSTPPRPEASRLPAMVDAKTPDKPSRQSSPWVPTRNLPVKESPARPPDPERLKALWSQASNDKAGLQPVNSLEGIADDLTALPFTIQDVKLEGGETPPPPSGPSTTRMSLHDVTRAFQQVPPSSSSTSQKPSISPPSTTAPVARPAPSNYSYPIPPNNMRPTYAAYPSPMMSHSPSPTIMYPHVVSSPVPARMQPNGHAPMYNPPPMWMPVQPSAQNSNGMMRPMASPYGSTMVPYPANGPPPTMYPASSIPTNMSGTPQSQNLRNRNVPVMSPAMQHAPAAMYPGSPAMMHMQMTPTTGYMPLPGGRGQHRPENGQMGLHQPNPAQPSTSHPGFSPVPHSPFMRNW